MNQEIDTTNMKLPTKDRVIDVSKLHIGMVVKNYSTMCELIGDEVVVSKGNSRVAQKKNWKRYFDWDTQGQKYIIKEIYSYPLPEEIPPNATYVKVMELALMLYLTQKQNGTYVFFSVPLMEKVGMVNKEYYKFRNENDYIWMFGSDGKIDKNVSYSAAKSTSRKSYERLSQILDGSLKSLAKHHVIHYEKDWAVKETPEDQYGGWRRATSEEKVMITGAEQYALNKLGTTSSWFASTYRRQKYQEYMQEYIQLNGVGIYMAARANFIDYHRPDDEYLVRVARKITSQLRDANTPEYIIEAVQNGNIYGNVQWRLTGKAKEIMNKITIDALMSYINKEIGKAKKKMEWGAPDKDRVGLVGDEIEYIANDGFLREFILLVNRYICITDSNKVPVDQVAPVVEHDGVVDDEVDVLDTLVV